MKVVSCHHVSHWHPSSNSWALKKPSQGEPANNTAEGAEEMEKLADAKPLVPDRREEISQIIDGWKEIDREADRSVDRSTDRSGNTLW